MGTRLPVHLQAFFGIVIFLRGTTLHNITFDLQTRLHQNFHNVIGTIVNNIHEHTSSFGTKLEGPSNNGLGISRPDNCDVRTKPDYFQFPPLGGNTVITKHVYKASIS